MEAMEAILRRCASDPDFLKRFVEDPVATARAEGIQMPEANNEQVVAALLAAGSAGQQVAELLQARISQMGIIVPQINTEQVVSSPLVIDSVNLKIGL